MTRVDNMAVYLCNMNNMTLAILCLMAAMILVKGLQGLYNSQLQHWEDYAADKIAIANQLKKDGLRKEEAELCSKVMRRLSRKPMLHLHKIQYMSYWHNRSKRIKA